MENKLKQLGLTNNEIKVYVTLLDIGENTVGPIIKKLRIHRQVAYDALEGLEEKNMVIHTTKNGRRYYRIADSKNILDDIKYKERIARSLMPEINKKLTGQKKGQEIKVYEGQKVYRELVLKNDESMPANSETYVISGAALKYEEVMRISHFLEKSNKIRKKKNIKTKLLFGNDLREEAKNTPRVNKECRFLDQEYNPPVSLQIWHNSVNLISFGNDVFVIEIKNEDFRQAYLNYFNLLWKIAKK